MPYEPCPYKQFHLGVVVGRERRGDGQAITDSFASH